MPQKLCWLQKTPKTDKILPASVSNKVHSLATFFDDLFNCMSPQPLFGQSHTNKSVHSGHADAVMPTRFSSKQASERGRKGTWRDLSLAWLWLLVPVWLVRGFSTIQQCTDPLKTPVSCEENNVPFMTVRVKGQHWQISRKPQGGNIDQHNHRFLHLTTKESNSSSLFHFLYFRGSLSQR